MLKFLLTIYVVRICPAMTRLLFHSFGHLLVLWLLTCESAAAFPVPVHTGSLRTYACTPTAESLFIDGQLNERAWQLADWSSDFLDIQGESQPAPRLRTRVKMLWDQRYFYVAAQMGEPHVWGKLTQRDAVIYYDNDFEIFIDPDGDNHLYYELEINALGTEWDLMLIKPYRDGAPAINAWDIQGLKSAVHIEGTVNDPSDMDTGWSVEIAIPWDVLTQAAGRQVPPAPGDIWRVNFSRVQWHTRIEDGQYVKITDPETGKNLPEDNWVWSPQGLIAMHYPERWGEVLFVDGSFDGNLARAINSNTEHHSIMAGQVLMDLYYQQRQWQEDHGRFAHDLFELNFKPKLMARTWDLKMEGTDRRFEARLHTPGCDLSVNEEGQLVRSPLSGDRSRP